MGDTDNTRPCENLVWLQRELEDMTDEARHANAELDREQKRVSELDAENKALREALIKSAEAVGACASNDVSTEFLLLVPDEVRTWCAKIADAALRGEEGEGDETIH